MLEEAIQRLISEGIITEEELQQRIEEAKTNSPLIDINNLALIVGALINEIADLTVRIEMLEGDASD